MSFEPYKIDRQGFQVINDTNTETMSFTMEGTDRGLNLEYDIGTANPKRFSIKPSGINWVDNTSNHTTGLERLALVQTAFQAVELPPNATTLKLNDTILVDAGVANQSTTINDGTAIFSNADVGGALNPQIQLINTNATGSVALEVYKNKPTAVVAGDVLFNQSVFGKDSALNKQEYTRITHTIRDGTSGIEDGSIEFGCLVNGSFNNFLQINGNQNEVNLLKPIDLNNNDIKTTTGDIHLNANGSSGNGKIILKPKEVSGVETISMPLTSVPTDEFVIEKSANATTFYQVGGAVANTNAQMRLGYGGLRVVSINPSVAPTFELDNAVFQTATHQFVGTNYNLTLPSAGEINFINANLDMNGGSILTSTGNIELNATASAGTGDIVLTPKSSVVLNTQIQMPTTSGTISYSNITGFLSIDFASQSTGYFELSNLGLISISGLTLTNGRIGGEYHILLRGQLGFSYLPATNTAYKANTYSLTTANGSEWIVLKICRSNTLSQYLVNATLYT